MARRRRKRKSGKWVGRVIAVLLSVPGAYLVAALIGSLVPLNRAWTEPEQGTTIYLADNGIHTDILMPVAAQGLDWAKVVRNERAARWIAFGAGEQHVYLDTPSWSDITLPTVWSAIRGGPRVMHVEFVGAPSYAARAIRLRPEEYRRLWASIRAEFAVDPQGRAERLAHPGYDCCDAFYQGVGKASAARTCNTWVADRLRLAGVKVSVWPPFAEGLLWRYRRVPQST